MLAFNLHSHIHLYGRSQAVKNRQSRASCPDQRFLQCMVVEEWYNHSRRRIIWCDFAIETQCPRPRMTKTGHRIRSYDSCWIGRGAVPRIQARVGEGVSYV
jgi:hypothetical protein